MSKYPDPDQVTSPAAELPALFQVCTLEGSSRLIHKGRRGDGAPHEIGRVEWVASGAGCPAGNGCAIRLIARVAGNKLSIEHPNKPLALLTCRFTSKDRCDSRPAGILRIHASNDVDAMQGPFQDHRNRESEEPLEMKMAPPSVSTQRVTSFTIYRAGFNVLRTSVSTRWRWFPFFPARHLLFPIDDIVEANANLIFGCG